MYRLVDEWVVGVGETEIDVLSLLDDRIVPAIVDSKGNKLDLFASRLAA